MLNTENLSNNKGRRFKQTKRKVNKKRIFIIGIILVLVALSIASGLYFINYNANGENKEETSKEISKEISKKLLEEKQYKEMKIENINMDIDESSSHFKCTIINITDKKYDGEYVKIVFKKEDNSEVARFEYHIESIEPGEKEEINMVTTTNLIEAYDFFIEAK